MQNNVTLVHPLSFRTYYMEISRGPIFAVSQIKAVYNGITSIQKSKLQKF